MKTKILLFFVIGLVLFACKKDEKPVIINNGDLYVKIYLAGSYMPTPLKGVKIYTVPATQEILTDDNGSVLFKDLKVGKYDVYAERVGYRMIKTSVDIVGANKNAIDLSLHFANDLGFMPSIDITSPLLPANFSVNDNVVFSLTVRDNDTPLQDLKVVISSDLDGKLVETHPDLNNTVRFETTTLSSGIHQISITATDKDKYMTYKTFALSTLVPGKIVMDTAFVSNGNVQINWQKYVQRDFERYEIFSTTDPLVAGQPVTTIKSAVIGSYVDKTAPIVSALYYYIKVTNKAGMTNTSNKVKVDFPSGKIYPYSVVDVVHNPVKPIVYIVDEYSRSLKAINYETGTEIKSIALLGTTGRIDIGDNGSGIDANGNNVEVYVPSSNGNIYVYDGNTLSLVKTIVTGQQNLCVATNGHGYLVVTVGTQWSAPTRTYSTKTGQFISSMDGGYNGEFIRFVPNTDNIFTISVGLSPADLNYYELSGTGTFLLHKDDTYHGDYPLFFNIFKMSPNGLFFVTGGEGAVYYTTSNITYKGAIQRGGFSFSDFAFSNDGNTIYGATIARNSVQIIKYPELTRSAEILLKGYGHYIFYFNGYLISLSEVGSGTRQFGIEKIKVD